MPRSSSPSSLPTGSRLLADRYQDLHHRSRVNQHRNTLAHRRAKCLPQRNTQLYLRNLLAQFRHSFVNSLRTLP
ncbi:MAG: hypothetical protein ACFCU9_10370 [Cyanophyceae cyanobacterium]